MLTLDLTACRHGEKGDCLDCCMASLDRLSRQLGDADAVHVMDAELFGRLKSVVAALRMRLMYFQEHEVHGSEDSSVYFSPRAEEPPPKRFQPLIVPVPAFSGSGVSATAPTQATQGEPAVVIPFPGSGRRRWTQEETEVLKRAYDKYPGQWERMRKEFSVLRSFTGVQLKDKWRATYGERRSSMN